MRCLHDERYFSLQRVLEYAIMETFHYTHAALFSLSSFEPYSVCIVQGVSSSLYLHKCACTYWHNSSQRDLTFTSLRSNDQLQYNTGYLNHIYRILIFHPSRSFHVSSHIIRYIMTAGYLPRGNLWTLSWMQGKRSNFRTLLVIDITDTVYGETRPATLECMVIFRISLLL